MSTVYQETQLGRTYDTLQHWHGQPGMSRAVDFFQPCLIPRPKTNPSADHFQDCFPSCYILEDCFPSCYILEALYALNEVWGRDYPQLQDQIRE